MHHALKAVVYAAIGYLFGRWLLDMVSDLDDEISMPEGGVAYQSLHGARHDPLNWLVRRVSRRPETDPDFLVIGSTAHAPRFPDGRVA